MKAYLKIEMPTNCAHCMMWSICPALTIGEWPDYESILTNDVIGDGGATPGIRHPDCPLVPVPPHGRLIDADEIKTAFPCGESVRTECVRATIEHAPTVIPAEEVYGQYTDTAGNYHWCGTHSGEHTIKKKEGE